MVIEDTDDWDMCVCESLIVLDSIDDCETGDEGDEEVDATMPRPFNM